MLYKIDNDWIRAEANIRKKIESSTIVIKFKLAKLQGLLDQLSHFKGLDMEKLMKKINWDLSNK